MFVCRKKNRSGSTSVVVVDKYGGKFKELHTLGVSKNEDEISALCEKGRLWINKHLGIQELNFDGSDNKDLEVEMTRTVLDNIDSILLNGAKQVYDSIGFKVIADDVLRHSLWWHVLASP